MRQALTEKRDRQDARQTEIQLSTVTVHIEGKTLLIVISQLTAQ